MKIKGEMISSSNTTVVAGAPCNSSPKSAISLSGMATTTEIDMSTHNNKTMDRIFNDKGNGFQPFIFSSFQISISNASPSDRVNILFEQNIDVNNSVIEP